MGGLAQVSWMECESARAGALHCLTRRALWASAGCLGNVEAHGDGAARRALNTSNKTQPFTMNSSGFALVSLGRVPVGCWAESITADTRLPHEAFQKQRR